MDGKGGWVERQGRVTRHEVNIDEKDRVLAEIDPTEKEVRVAAKHDALRKHLASHKGKVREDTKAKNSRRGKKGRAQKDV
jgi:hypothetical protein